MKKDKQNKPKKEKIIYIDDNSTIADMSGTRRVKSNAPKRQSTFKEKMKTYFSVVKKMILPMLVTLLTMTIVFIIFMALAGRL